LHCTLGDSGEDTGFINVHALLHAGGRSISIEELNTKDAYVTCPGAAGITVRSLSGTSVLATAGKDPSATISLNLSGTVGHVVATTGGAPITCNLPQSQGTITTSPSEISDDSPC